MYVGPIAAVGNLLVQAVPRRRAPMDYGHRGAAIRVETTGRWGVACQSIN